MMHLTLSQDLSEREGVVQGGEARLRSLQAQAEARERDLDSRERAVLELQQIASGERQVGLKFMSLKMLLVGCMC